MKRRHFLRATAAAAVAFPAIARSADANSKVSVAVIGVSGRGRELAGAFAGLANVEVAALCDVDDGALAKATASLARKTPAVPRGERDFRRLLEDKSIDAVVIATPDHWHAPAAILACAAGKHVYLEKPCSHNPQEGEWLVAAARKDGRLVQHGTQRRSWPGVQEAIAKLREGAIGRVLRAQAYYFNNRPTIGHGKAAPVPAGLDWALWQGPAPEREFRDNFVPYHWHWFWHWGTGELGNNGVHMIDLCRWGLGADHAQRITSGGRKLRYDDDQESPDTNVVLFDTGTATIQWECRSWAARTPHDLAYDVAFFGENGSLLITGGGYTIHDAAGKETARGTGPGGNDTHLQNFVDAIRSGSKLNAEIEEGHKSTLLCHLGNIAWRTGQTIDYDARGGMVGDERAKKLWRREYRPGWEPRVA
jgi:predicted dehydrogenase